MSDEELRSRLAAQRIAFDVGPPDHGRRMEALATLRDGLQAREADLARALDADFGGRSADETRMLELFPLLDQIADARRNLKRWMRRRRVRSTWFLWPSRAFYQYQPLGVVGVIGAWNYQLLLTLGPLVDALAAGNHVMVKPSERAPRAAEAIASLLADVFPPDYVSCVTGGPDVARSFSALPFDHLIFTGSARTGRDVMRAAAANLTPVTLELGGKSPAIVHESYPLDLAVRRIMTAKLYNAGQTCVAPDYVLVPAGREAAFEAEARRVVAALYPASSAGSDYTRVVDAEHHERLRTLISGAEAAGARVVPLGAEGEAPDHDSRSPDAGRVIAPTLVFHPTDAMRLMQEEIFGPILPVLAYDTLEAAIDFVRARSRPLALYYFDEDRRRVDHLLDRTLSGGVTVGDCVFHLAQRRLPFGGVGASGMGQYRGVDGFVTFSKKRGVMVQRRWALTSLFHPPYAGRTRTLVRWLMRFTGR